MAPTVKPGIKPTFVRADMDWGHGLPHVLYGYCRRNRTAIHSPYRLIYGVEPQMVASDSIALFAGATPHHRIVELLNESGKTAVRVTRAAKSQ